MFIAMPFEEYLGLGFMEDQNFYDEDNGTFDFEENAPVHEEEDDEKRKPPKPLNGMEEEVYGK